MQVAFYFNQNRCTGCDACIVACKDWHDVPAGSASWLRLITVEKGEYPDLFVAHLFAACYHCAHPACVVACPVDAITKRTSDGVVVVDREACVGHDKCDMCFQECPYYAPQFGLEENAKMQKCDYCLDRLVANKEPICVAACPVRALEAGPLETLQAKYGDVNKAEAFTFSDDLMPSIVFNPKIDDKDLPLQRTVVTPKRT